MPRRVAYVCSDELLAAADCLPANEGRASLVHSLCTSYGLLAGSHDPEDAVKSTPRVVTPPRASREELTRFHDERFIGKSQSAFPRKPQSQDKPSVTIRYLARRDSRDSKRQATWARRLRIVGSFF